MLKFFYKLFYIIFNFFIFKDEEFLAHVTDFVNEVVPQLDRMNRRLEPIDGLMPPVVPIDLIIRDQYGFGTRVDETGRRYPCENLQTHKNRW